MMNHYRHFHCHRRLNDHFLQNLAKKKEYSNFILREKGY
jgi:uncharacterized CHY-type Zn-finger protein